MHVRRSRTFSLDIDEFTELVASFVDTRSDDGDNIASITQIVNGRERTQSFECKEANDFSHQARRSSSSARTLSSSMKEIEPRAFSRSRASSLELFRISSQEEWYNTLMDSTHSPSDVNPFHGISATILASDTSGEEGEEEYEDVPLSRLQ